MSNPLKIPKYRPQKVLIKDVAFREGRSYKPNWSRPMFEVETDVGTYIAPTLESHQREMQNGHYEQWDARVGEHISVFTSFDGDFHWINSAERLEASKENNGDFVSLTEAIENGLPPKNSYVYQIIVGGREYIGFTTQNPQNRIEQHLSDAKEGSKQAVHIALRRFGYLHEFNILSEHPSEVEGLVAEITAIEKIKPELNSSLGGEGNDFDVDLRMNEFDEEVFAVIDKRGLT